MKPLVSIITPCYNGGKTIARLMDSVLAQTYNNIEFILVNDGSTDNTEAIVKTYEEKFTQKGYKFKYFYQENKGLGGAINAGLKIFKGEYLCWPDADDYLEPTSVEDRVKVLEENPEYAVVTSNAYIRKSDDLESYTLLVKDAITQRDEWQFENMLKEKSVFCSGCHMVRTKQFLEVNPDREIYPARRGQNWQILLPIYYKFKRYYLDKPLYNYIDYPLSMSKNVPTMNSILNRYNEHEKIILTTLKMIESVQKVDLSKYKNYIIEKYCKCRMAAALKYGEDTLFDIEYKKIRNKKEFKLMIQYIRRHIKFVNMLYLKIKG